VPQNIARKRLQRPPTYGYAAVRPRGLESPPYNINININININVNVNVNINVNTNAGHHRYR